MAPVLAPTLTPAMSARGTGSVRTGGSRGDSKGAGASSTVCGVGSGRGDSDAGGGDSGGKDGGGKDGGGGEGGGDGGGDGGGGEGARTGCVVTLTLATSCTGTWSAADNCEIVVLSRAVTAAAAAVAFGMIASNCATTLPARTDVNRTCDAAMRSHDASARTN
jgi:hypothetical protein